VIQQAVGSLDKQGKSKAAFKNAQKGAAKAAAGVFVGSFFLGPVGLVIGGVIGVGYAYASSEDYDGFLIVWQQMSQQEREELNEKFLGAVTKEAMTPDNLLRLLLQFKDNPGQAVPFLTKAMQGLKELR